jgi:hypothetical protein
MSRAFLLACQTMGEGTCRDAQLIPEATPTLLK